MGRMETEYRGHTIYYSENMDEWDTSDGLGSYKTLSNAKRAIDKMYLRMRKGAAVEAFYVDSHGGTKLIPVTIIDYKQPIRDTSYSNNKGVVDHYVYAMGKRRHNERASRSQYRLHSLVLPHAGKDEWLAEVHAIEAEIETLKRKRAHVMGHMPRASIDDIADLVKASKGEPNE